MMANSVKLYRVIPCVNIPKISYDIFGIRFGINSPATVSMAGSLKNKPLGLRGLASDSKLTSTKPFINKLYHKIKLKSTYGNILFVFNWEGMNKLGRS